MRTKLPEYDSLAVFRTDFELICRNAMTYNTVDTIYYKSADKLIRYGQKFFSVEKLRSMKTHLAFASIIPDECLGKLSFYVFFYHQYLFINFLTLSKIFSYTLSLLYLVICTYK